MIAHLEEADSECCQVKNPLLTFVVAGGGFAGVETVAGINDFVRGALKSYRNLREEMVRVVLVHPGQFILPELGGIRRLHATQTGREESRDSREYEGRGGYGPQRHAERRPTEIFTNTLVWTAGTSPNPLLAGMPCVKERGRLVVNEFLELRDWPNVWALGDCTAIPNAKDGGFHPPTAQHALRQGKTLAANILAAIRGGDKRAFTFSTIGQLAAIGRRTGVANIFGVNFSGFLAWWNSNHLPEQASGIRKESSGSAGLDAGPYFFEGPGAVSGGQGAHRLEAGRDARDQPRGESRSSHGLSGRGRGR